MPSKEEKDRLKKMYLRQEKLKFESSLPMDKTIFRELFKYLDDKIGDEGCDNTLKLTLSFLRQSKITNIDEVTSWLEDEGGYCDCEVLANIEEHFE
jgi:Protein of unknown function (DUF2695)